MAQDITLVWDSPQGDLDSFEVQYLDAQGRLIQNFTYTNSISIGGLRPYRNQFFILVAINLSGGIRYNFGFQACYFKVKIYVFSHKM